MSRRVAPIRTADRQVNQFNAETRAELARLEGLISGSATSRLMPEDDYTYLRWPCDDIGITRTIVRETVRNVPLAVSAGAQTGVAGCPVQRRCLALNGTDAGLVRGADVTTATVPPSTTITLSCWARVDRVSTAAYMLGYFTNAGTVVAALYLASGVPTVAFRLTGAGATAVAAATVGLNVAPGEWHHYFGIFTGTKVYVGFDGVFCNVATVAADTINWTTGAGHHWSLGYTGLDTAMLGLICDARVDACVRDRDNNDDGYLREAYERGIGMFDAFEEADAA